MAEPGVESPQPRQYRRHESMKEYRQVKANEKRQELEKSAEREHKRQAALKAISKDKPEVANRADLIELSGTELKAAEQEQGDVKEQQREKTRGEKAQAADEIKGSGQDKWKPSGTISISGDNLTYLPNQDEIKKRGGYSDEAYDPENPGNYEFILEYEKRRVERGLKLGIEVNTDTFDPELITKLPELKKVPTPLLWEILDKDPSSSDKSYTFNARAYSTDSLKLKRYLRESDQGEEANVMFAWNKVTVDKETLVKMQQKAIEYLEGQVKQGQIPEELLSAATGILESRGLTDPIVQKWLNKEGSGSVPEDPKLHRGWFTLIRRWDQNGRIRQEGDSLIYDDDKLRKKEEYREVFLAVEDKDNPGKKLLTKQAWEILRLAPKNFKYNQVVE